jgi:hypothetical protein
LQKTTLKGSTYGKNPRLAHYLARKRHVIAVKNDSYVFLFHPLEMDIKLRYKQNLFNKQNKNGAYPMKKPDTPKFPPN